MSLGGGGHAHLLYKHGSSVLHRLPAHLKIVSMLAFALIVVATPPDEYWVFAGYAALLGGVAIVSRIPAGFIVRRMVVELPFVFFALLMPFISTGERIMVGGLSMSEDGLLTGWNILAKGTLGVVAAILLASTTDVRALLLGLQRLRLPAQLVEIVAFMVRYADVIGDELHRMRIARESRAFDGRHLGHVRVLARTSGSLFVRSYERGERVYQAMQARGYSGAMPLFDDVAARPAMWATVAALPAAAAVLLVVGRMLT